MAQPSAAHAGLRDRNVPQLEPTSTLSVIRCRGRSIVDRLSRFMAAGIIVSLIVACRTPDHYLHLIGTHAHHLNYGIVLLSGWAHYLLSLGQPGRKSP